MKNDIEDILPDRWTDGRRSCVRIWPRQEEMVQRKHRMTSSNPQIFNASDEDSKLCIAYEMICNSSQMSCMSRSRFPAYVEKIDGRNGVQILHFLAISRLKHSTKKVSQARLLLLFLLLSIVSQRGN